MEIYSPNTIDRIFKNWHPSYAGHHLVYIPPGWKNKVPVPYIFVFVNAELSAEEYFSFFKCSILYNIANTRIFTPRTLQYASCLHPTFYHAVKHSNQKRSKDFHLYLEQLHSLRMNGQVSPESGFGSIRHWLQSVVFLAGVTLSAALIQNRWSLGTLESKLNRLWQVGSYAEIKGLESLRELKSREFVLQCAAQLESNPAYVLKKLKLFYSALLKNLAKDLPADKREMKEVALTSAQKEKFGFVNELHTLLPNNIKCVLLYGSATNSAQFADYDLMVVVKDLNSAMECIAGKSPHYKGLELNISLFDEEDFWAYQLASGDNLFDHALCLYGSVKVPHKSFHDLVARNFSFGFIRFRQLMGMAAHLHYSASEPDDKRNLLDYFIKIPLNVYKGIQGCYGAVGSNEEIKEWARTALGFDVKALQLHAREGFSTESISRAAWATQEVMHEFDKKNNIFIPEKKASMLALESYTRIRL